MTVKTQWFLHRSPSCLTSPVRPPHPMLEMAGVFFGRVLSPRISFFIRRSLKVGYLKTALSWFFFLLLPISSGIQGWFPTAFWTLMEFLNNSWLKVFFICQKDMIEAEIKCLLSHLIKTLLIYINKNLSETNICKCILSYCPSNL